MMLLILHPHRHRQPQGAQGSLILVDIIFSIVGAAVSSQNILY